MGEVSYDGVLLFRRDQNAKLCHCRLQLPPGCYKTMISIEIACFRLQSGEVGSLKLLQQCHLSGEKQKLWTPRLTCDILNHQVFIQEFSLTLFR